MWVGASALLAIGVKGLEIPRRVDYQFFELPPGNVRAGKLLERLDHLVKPSFGRFDGHLPPDSQRVLLWRQIGRTIERVRTGLVFGSITRASHLHRPENASQAAPVRRRRREGRARRIPYRPDRFPPAGVSRDALGFSHQLTPHPLPLPLQVTMLPLTRLLRT